MLHKISAEDEAVSMLMELEMEETRSIEDDFVVLSQHFSWGIRNL